MSRRTPPKPLGFHWDQRERVIHADGRKGCRWCKRPVDPPRRTFCGDPTCLEEWQRRSNWSLTRQGVYERARGLCALCGLDLATISLEIIQTQAYLAEVYVRRGVTMRQYDRVVLARDGRPYPPSYWHRRHEAAIAYYAEHKIRLDQPAWDVDHIVPVSAGGDWFDWSNLRLLCKPCHHRVTSEYARSRSRDHTRPERRNGRKAPRRRAG